MIFKFNHQCTVSPAYDSVDAISLIILHCCTLMNKVTLDVMPMFYPTEFMFKKYPDLPKWEAYATATREVMAKVGDFKLSN